jgi:hypothetical protein
MLGRLSAPVTLVEYVDLRCARCRAYARTLFPTLVREYVRPGRLRIEMRLQAALGEDSVKAARSVVAAGFQDRGWDFAQLLLLDRARPDGAVTPDLLRSITAAVPELDGTRLARDAASPAATRPLAQGRADLDLFGFDARALPAFRIGPTAGALRPIAPAALRRAVRGGSLPYIG